MAGRRRGNVEVKVKSSFDGRGVRDGERALTGLERTGRRTAGGMSTLARGAAGAAAVLSGSLLVETKRSIEAFGESEAAQGRMEAQLRSTGLSVDRYGEKIDKVIQRQSRLGAFDDEALQDSFTALLRATGDVDESLRLNAVAMDLARGKQMDVAKAGEVLGKVYAGNTGILGRYGIQIKDGATAQEALRVVQERFAGQSETFGRKNTASYDRLKVSIENVEEAIGSGASPAVAVLAQRIETLSRRAQPAFERVGRDVEKIFGRKDLDLGEKLQLSSRSVRRNLIVPLEREVERAHLGDRLADAVDDGLPKVMEAAGRGGTKATAAFLKGWWNADGWGKLATVGFLTAKLGGFKAAGALVGGSFGTTFGRRLAKEEAIVGAGDKVGGRFGRAFGAAAGPLITGAILAAIFDDEIKEAGSWLADLFTGGDAPEGFRTPEEAERSLRRGSRDLERRLENSDPGSRAPGLILGGGGRTSWGDLGGRLGNLVGSGPSSRSSGGGSGGSGTGGSSRSTRSGAGDQAVDWARGAIGHFAESSGRNTGPELDRLEKQFGMKAAAWCAMFATRAIVEGGAPEATMTALVANIAAWAKQGTHGYMKGIKQKPKAGDLMLFNTNTPTTNDDHVGVVEKILSGGRIRTIEGNTSAGKVARVTRRMGEGVFARPDYRNPLGASSDSSRVVLTRQQRIVRDAARAAGIDPAILWGVFGQETRFGELKNDSPAGAQGPFQLMPGTARELGVSNPRNFREAARGAARYLARYKNRGTRGMLAAYNAGPFGNPDNAETRKYVPGVLNYAKRWPGDDAGGGSNGSPLTIAPTDMRRIYEAIVAHLYQPIGRALERSDKPMRSRLREQIAGLEDVSVKRSLTERRHALTDEDLTTQTGRTARLVELADLRQLATREVTILERRRELLGRRLATNENFLAQAKNALKAAPTGAKGAKRAIVIKLAARIKDIKDEAAQLGVTLPEAKLGLAEIDAEADRVFNTPNEVDESFEQSGQSWSMFDTDDLGIAEAQRSGNKQAIRDALVKKRGDALYQLAVMASRTPDPRDDTELLGVIKSLDEDIKGLDETVQEATDTTKEQLEVTKQQLAEVQRRLNTSEAQFRSFQQWQAESVGSVLGRSASLGGATVAAPGMVATL